MGSSQEKKDLEKFSSSSEGKSIIKISESFFTQNIYVCGDYDINFFKNNIIEPLRFPKSDVEYCEKIAKHKVIKDWHFFFAHKGKNSNDMSNNAKNFINKHIDIPQNNLDDFNEVSKDRDGKNVILYFIDENKDNFLNYFIKEFNQFIEPLFIIVGNKDENEKIKQNIEKSLTSLKKTRNIDKNIFKFSNFSDNVVNNLIELNFNLIETSEFYNELGDEFKYPKQFMDDGLFDIVAKEMIKNFSTLNILICGRPGAGKSTFINGIMKATVSRSRKGGECSSRIIRYIHRSLPIAFYDTPGMSTEQKMEEIIELIKKKNIELEDMQSKIHAVFYLFNGKDPRFFCNFENKMFNLLEEKKIPIYFIVTQFNDKEDFEENKIVIIQNYLDVTKNIPNTSHKSRKEYIENNIFCVNMIGGKYSEANELFKKMYKDFQNYIELKEINKYNLEEITKNNYLISKLKEPKDIISHPQKLCQEINLTYRLIARSISADENGATFLSSSYLRIINNIFCEKDLEINQCRQIIKNMNFDLDEKDVNSKKDYKHWFKNYFGYKTPAEEQISYIGYGLINQYCNKLKNNEDKCLEYINKLRESLNKAIKGLQELSVMFQN